MTRGKGPTDTVLARGHSALNRGRELNKLLVVFRGRRLEVYVNGSAVCEPIRLEQDLTPVWLYLHITACNKETRVEYAEMTVWSADNLPAPSAVDTERRGHAEVLLKQAEAALKDGQYKQAIAACTEALRLDPRSAKAYFVRACASAERPRSGPLELDDVIRDCTEAIHLNPKAAEFFVQRSWAYLNKKVYPDCIADANEALKLESASSGAYANRGCALANLGHYELALADYDEALRLGPPCAIHFLIRGLIHAKRGSQALARADREKALQQDPGLRDSTVRLDDPPPLSAEGSAGHIRTFKGTRSINSVALSPNGRLALSGDDDNTCRLWDVATGKELYRFPGHRENVMCVAFSPDGRLALSAGSRTVRPDGSWGPGSDFHIHLWDVATRKLLRTLEGHTQTVSRAVFSPNSKQVLSADFIGVVRLWEVESGKTVQRLVHPQSVWDVAFSPDGSQALTAGGLDQSLHLWDLKTGKQVHEFKGQTGLVRCVAFSPDGSQALSGSLDKTVCLWDLAAKKKLKTFPEHLNAVHCVAFASKGCLAIAGTGGTAVGTNVSLGGPDCALHIYDLATGKELSRFDGHSSNVLSIAVAEDGRHILSGSADGTMRLWRLPKAE